VTFYKTQFRIKRSESPALVVFETETGAEIPYELKVGSKRGLFLNAIPEAIWKLITRK
jgi:hypothetical protein